MTAIRTPKAVKPGACWPLPSVTWLRTNKVPNFLTQPTLPFLQPITLSELESYLWEAANILRGSPVDRTEWKIYILLRRA